MVFIGKWNDPLINAQIFMKASDKSYIMDNLSEVGMICDYEYADSFFNDDAAYMYDHELAIASCCLATAAMVKDGAPYNTPKAAENMLNDIGFGDDLDESLVFSETYQAIPQMNSIAYVIANKHIAETDTTVIAVAVRGGGYQGEWGGNFNVGSDIAHEGFSLAADQVLKGLNSFVKDNGSYFCRNVKFWITGYSRSAATANLVAARLDERTKLSSDYSELKSLRFDPEAVFAYCFETPLNTTADNTRSEVFQNIFNIVNRIDPVPRVAPSVWHFSRYGVDCFLPAKEITGKAYTDMRKRMETYYPFISLNKTYSEDFRFKSIKIESLSPTDPWGYPISITDYYVVIQEEPISQGVFLDEMIQILAKEIFQSRQNYVKKWQSAVTRMVYKFMAGEKMSDALGERSFFSYLAQEFTVRHLYDVIVTVKGESVLKQCIKEAVTLYFADAGMEYDDVSEAVENLYSILLPLLSHPDYLITAVENGESLFLPHYTETTLSWLRAIKGFYSDVDNNGILKLLTGGKGYRIATINCPVNIRVYDADGELRGEIVENEVQDVGENGLTVYMNENGEKSFILPDCEAFRFEIEAYGDGEMSMSFADYSFDLEEKTDGENYYDIPIQNGTAFTVTLDEKSEEGVTADVAVYDKNNNEINASETIDYTEAEEYTISVNSDSEDCFVMGGGDYFKGEFAQVTAIPAEAYDFLGWAETGAENGIVSVSNQYRFRVEHDTSLTAKFSPHQYEFQPEKSAPATCTEDGTKVYLCSVCGRSKTESVFASGHAWGSWTMLNETQHQRVCGNDASHVETENHAWDAGRVTEEPSYDRTGIKTFTCTVCGETRMEKIPPLVHSPHTWGEWTVIKEATETEEGERRRICSGCGAVDREVIPKKTPAEKPAVMLGDVNGDGKVTAADARLALRRAVGLETYEPGSDRFLACDVDKNGKVNAADARKILRASVNLEDPKTW